MKKILYGVCGIGNGHTQRQLPLIEYLSQENKIVIFAYDTSFKFYSDYFQDDPQATVLEVAVPFYVGSKDGIDFEATKNLPSNQKDYDRINSKSIATAEKILGMPDVVITDYEPTSAQYAYEHHAPLVTIDQQSKYLIGEFSPKLHDQTYADEVARLKMFFPTATVRIACSFFDVTKKKNGEDVLMVSPIIKSSILNMKNNPKKPLSILVYFSSQREFQQNLHDIAIILSEIPEVQFHVFARNIDKQTERKNLHFYKHGDNRFSDVLRDCSGIVSTAGHTLLSEAMYLGIPVYAIPFPLYEQEMNAEVVHKNMFGIKSKTVNEQDLKSFIKNIPRYRDSIKRDKRVLLRGSGEHKIIKVVENILASKKQKSKKLG